MILHPPHYNVMLSNSGILGMEMVYQRPSGLCYHCVLLPGQLRATSDVYSFGIILLQLLTGKKATDNNYKLTHEMDKNLAPKVMDPTQWIDPLLDGKYSAKGVMLLAILAKHCIKLDWDSRQIMLAISERLDVGIAQM